MTSLQLAVIGRKLPRNFRGPKRSLVDEVSAMTGGVCTIYQRINPEGDMLRTQMAIVRRLSKYEPFNTIAARQTIANRVIEAGKYVLA